MPRGEIMDKIMFCTDGKIGSEHCPGAHDIVEYYTQITLNGQCVIPEPKPDSEYLDNHPAQNVHYFECKVPFNAVIIPCLDQREYLFPPEFKLEDYIVHACVEHIRITWISERIFERAIILMIWLQKSN